MRRVFSFFVFQAKRNPFPTSRTAARYRYRYEPMFLFCFSWQCIYLLFCNDKSTIIKIFVCHLGTKNFNLMLLRRNSGINLKKIALWPRKNIRKACEIFGARRVPFMLNSLFSFIQRIKSRMACLLLISNKAIFRLQNTQSLMTIVGEQWNKCGTIHSFGYLNR